MRIGICLPQLGPAADMPLISDFAVEAERAKFDSLWVEEHLMRPLHPVSGYGGVPGSAWPEKHRNALAPLEVLSFIAARTERVTLGTSILVVGYHHPLVLAKQAATLDRLSGGRFALGLGVGWCADEYELLGVPFRQRGAIADEVLEVLNLCWEPGPVEFHGRHVDIEPCETSPRPADGQHVRTYGGFVAQAGWRRTAQWCDVWNPYAIDPAVAVERLGVINQLAREEFDREPLELSLRILLSPDDAADPAGSTPGRWVGGVESLADRVALARQAGCHELLLDCNFAPHSDSSSFWEQLPERLAPVLTAAHGTG